MTTKTCELSTSHSQGCAAHARVIKAMSVSRAVSNFKLNGCSAHTPSRPVPLRHAAHGGQRGEAIPWQPLMHRGHHTYRQLQ